MGPLNVPQCASLEIALWPGPGRPDPAQWVSGSGWWISGVWTLIHRRADASSAFTRFTLHILGIRSGFSRRKPLPQFSKHSWEERLVKRKQSVKGK